MISAIFIRMQFISILVILVLLKPLATFGFEAASFEVAGEVRCSTFDQGTTNTFFSKFRAVVSGSNVLIRSTLAPSETENVVDYYEYVSPGSNSTFMVRYRDDFLVTNVSRSSKSGTQTTTLTQPRPPWNQATVMVRPDQLPPYGYEFLTVVWLAFGSKCHFAATDQRSVEPVVFVENGFRESQRKLESQWVVEPAPPGLLSFMAEFCDGNTYSTGKSASPKELPPPYHTGFTNALFRTTEWTNVAGLSLPRKFELIKFDPDYARKVEKRLRIAYILVGEAHAYTVGKPVTNLASVFPRRSRIIDYTLPDNKEGTDYTVYHAREGKLLGKQQLIDRSRKLEKRAAPAIRQRGAWFWSVLTICTLTAGPIILLFFLRKRRT